ncbi:MAG: DUF3857 domain-containing protein, partial [bacterium]|nr:DUF3857 domain-containing protein [bacterium]
MSHRSTLFLTIVCFALTVPLPAEEKNWLPQPFVAPAAEVIAAADELDIDTEDAKTVVMLEDVIYRFDGQGLQRRTRTVVFRYLTELGVDDWDTVGTRWQPWHQERPVLEARVLTPDGKVVSLDPTTISEAPDAGNGEDVFDDRRYLEAPLPMAQVGNIVEQRVTVNETQPRFPGGTTARFFPSFTVPAYHTRLVIEVDEAIELRWIAFLLDDVEPAVESFEGGTRYTFEFHQPEKRSEVEDNLPFDQPRNPHIAFSTGASWTAIASEYAKVVDEQIATADAAVLPDKPPANTTSRQEMVQSALDWVHDKVR